MKRLLGLIVTISMVVGMLTDTHVSALVEISDINLYSDGTMTIYDFETGDLESALADLTEDYLEITELRIYDGVVNTMDFAVISEDLSRLSLLVIDEDARVDSGLDDSVTTATADNKIPDWALGNNESIETLTINNAYTMGEGACYEMIELTEVTMEDLVSVGEEGFADCTNLSEVDLPSLVTIAYAGFYANESVTSLDMPALETVESEGLMGLTSLAEVNFPNLSSIGYGAFEGSFDEEAVVTLSLPSITTTAAFVFAFTGLTTVELPMIESIGDGAFDNSDMTDLYLGDTPPSVTSDVFSGLNNAAALHVSDGAGEAYWQDAGDGDATDDYWYGLYINEIGEDPSMDTIAIYSDGDLVVSLDGGSSSLEADVDYHMEEVSIDYSPVDPDVSISVDGEVLDGTTSNHSLEEGSNALTIATTSESGDSESIELTITRVSGRDILIESDYTSGQVSTEIETALDEGSLLDITCLTITEGILNDTDLQWIEDNLDNLQILEISSNAQVHSGTDITDTPDNYLDTFLYQLDDLEEVTMTSVLTIGYGIFGDSNVKVANFPSAVEFEYEAFLESRIEEVYAPNVTTVGEEVFYDAEALAYFDFSSIESIGDSAFGYTALTEVTIETNISMGSSAFAGIDDLVSVSLPEQTSIPYGAFRNSEGLETFYAPKVLSLGQRALDANTALKEVTLTSAVYIGDSAFFGDTALEEIELPAVVNIDYEAFEGATSLASMTLGTSVPSIGARAFNGLPDTRSLRVPYGYGDSYDLAEGDSDDGLWNGWTIDEISEDASLSDLTISSGTWDQSFDSDVLTYEVTMDNSVSSVTMTPTLTDSNATMTIDSDDWTSGDDLVIELSVGRTEISLLVTAEDETTQETYTIGLTREASDNANLSSISISDGSLSPGFDEDILSYSVSVDNDVTTLSLEASLDDDTASMTLEGQSFTGETWVDLDVGENDFSILVQAEDGSEQTYTLVISREAESDSTESTSDSSDDEEEGDNDNEEEDDDDNDNEEDDDGSSEVSDADLSSSLIEAITNGLEEGGSGTILLEAEDLDPISQDVFESLRGRDQTLQIQGEGFTWTFDGSASGQGDMSGDFDPAITVLDHDSLPRDIDNPGMIIIETAYHGTLPFAVQLSLEVPDVAEGMPVYLYVLNESTGKLELVGTGTEEKGQATFNLTHCSTFVVLDTPVLVEEVMTLSFVSGYEDGSFRPDDFLTRGEGAALLDRLLENTEEDTDSGLLDVDMWAEDSINQLHALGIITGYEDKTFRPDAKITRAEMAVMISRTMGLSPSAEGGFTDTDKHWAEEAIQAVQAAGIISGYPDGSFEPDASITRGEAVAIIVRALGREDEGSSEENLSENTMETAYTDVSKEHWAYLFIMNATSR